MAANPTAIGRVVFISASAGVWGAEESLLTLAKALKRQGHVVSLVCFAGPLADRWLSDIGSNASVAGSMPEPDKSKFAASKRLWRRYISDAQENDAVVLFTYYLVVPASLCLAVLQRKRVVVALDMHDNLAGKRGRMLLQIFSLAMHRIIAVSSFTAAQFGALKSRVTIITRPVDGSDAMVPRAVGGEGCRTRIGIVGRLVQDKGHALLIKAATLIEEDVEIVVRGAGDGSPYDVTDEMVQMGREHLGNRFIFEGSVPRSRAMDELDILVVGNDREPLGRTVIEAQLSGVVAVVPDAGGSSELVQHGVTGLKYAAGNAASLGNALQILASDPALRQDIIRTARSHAVITSSPETYAETYVKALGTRQK